MRMTSATIGLLVSSLPSLACRIMNQGKIPIQVIDLGPHDANPPGIKQSIPGILVRHNRVISDHRAHQIIAVHDSRAKIKVRISGPQILLSKIPSTIDLRDRLIHALHRVIEKRRCYHQDGLANELF
ncbi:MAG: hypothetical protein ABW076_15775 [Candidatus Thiodiazotropha sp.]